MFHIATKNVDQAFEYPNVKIYVFSFFNFCVLFFVCLGIFFMAVDKSTSSDLQLQDASPSIGFCEMALTRNTELAEALS